MKFSKADQIKFETLLIEFLTSLPGSKETTTQGHPFRTFNVPTRAGALDVKVVPAGNHLESIWVPCQFEDVDNANDYFGLHYSNLNKHSGKWNWHFLPEMYTIVEALNKFMTLLEELIPENELALPENTLS